ncbi:hypothetical protein [Avibacterium endocarditidis]|uniref:hypothetical protein n=1 Tax=Avibacterium TaxID=292486 RepID=UPI0039FC9FCD
MWIDKLIAEANKALNEVYEDLSNAVSIGLEAVSNTARSSVDWVWGTLLGNWNPNQTISQIVADVALGFVPIVGQILDLRDLTACIYALIDEKDKDKQKEYWLLLILTLIAIIPGAGDVIKGIGKIIILNIRRYGTKNVEKAAVASIESIKRLLQDEKVIKVLRNNNATKIITDTISYFRLKINLLNADVILSHWRERNEQIKRLLEPPYRLAMPEGVERFVKEALHSSEYVFSKASTELNNSLQEAKNILTKVLDELEKELNQLGIQAGKEKYTGIALEKNNPQVVRGYTNKRKGIYGEQVSDEFMEERNFRSMLSPERQKRLLEGETATGRGIDGVYANPKPPPPYIITETKFRTNAGEYIDSDGRLSKTNKVEDLLGSTKDGKQMSDSWIENRLKEAINNPVIERDISIQGYDKWLMIVDDNGKVVEIYQIASSGKDAKVIGTINIGDYQ